MEASVRIAGAAGQGIQTAADLLGRALTRSGLCAYLYNDAESRIRGGLNFCHLRVAPELRQGVVNRCDLLIALTPQAVQEQGPNLVPDGWLLCPERLSHPRRASVDIETLAGQAGSPKSLAVVAAAAAACWLGVARETLDSTIGELFSSGTPAAEINRRAVELGFEAALRHPLPRSLKLPAGPPAGRYWISGAEATALGAVAGGVRFVAGYPMSPATGTLTALAQWSTEANLVVEQAEDEIAAINMLAGASYAGARAMTATSGGGFCLMTEGLSLLGMIEAPGVILLAQRPGPATGLPTRTAQGDLRLALHAGHGFFPRILLAPRDLADGFSMTARAFDLSERYQVPVIVLTDQLLQEAQASVEPFPYGSLPTRRYFLSRDELEAMPAYQRYALTESGISPMAAPGASRHVVVADSDEHDPDGHLTEVPALALQMAKKRLRKAATLARELEAPLAVEGDPRQHALVVSFGSTHPTLDEARKKLVSAGRPFAWLHLDQLWPLPASLRTLLRDTPHLLTVENNVGGELSGLLSQVGLREPESTIQRMDGRPFAVDELEARLREALA
ncbi:MAG: 2-oxoacid:acceptor oxidoreductase subunit alpha [Myxococcales bacterium]|nr:2-oxoacid:acceptor oxidoreductase subunit alpha [Myxococcales bacterium]